MSKTVLEEKVAVSMSMKLPVPGVQYSSVETFMSFSKAFEGFTQKDKDELRKDMEEYIKKFVKDTNAQLIEKTGKSLGGAGNADEDLKKKLKAIEKENKDLNDALERGKQAYLKLKAEKDGAAS